MNAGSLRWGRRGRPDRRGGVRRRPTRSPCWVEGEADPIAVPDRVEANPVAMPSRGGGQLDRCAGWRGRSARSLGRVEGEANRTTCPITGRPQGSAFAGGEPRLQRSNGRCAPSPGRPLVPRGHPVVAAEAWWFNLDRPRRLWATGGRAEVQVRDAVPPPRGPRHRSAVVSGFPPAPSAFCSRVERYDVGPGPCQGAAAGCRRARWRCRLWVGREELQARWSASEVPAACCSNSWRGLVAERLRQRLASAAVARATPPRSPTDLAGHECAPSGDQKSGSCPPGPRLRSLGREPW